MLTPRELERLTRRFVQQIHDIIGPQRDIPAPDVNTNAQVMAWIMDEYSRMHGFSPAVVTGKPVDLFGSRGREEATGRGVVMALEEYLHDAGQGEVRGKTFAVQGFGNVGSWTSRFLHERGRQGRRRVRRAAAACSTARASTSPSCSSTCRPRAPSTGFPGTEPITNEDLLLLDVDVLVPAALGGVITEDNAKDVRARPGAGGGQRAHHAEGRRDPPPARRGRAARHLRQRRRRDGLATSSGRRTSSSSRGTRSAITSELSRHMREAYATLSRLVRERKVSFRTAAFIVAIGRVGRATVLRGV